VRNINMMTTWSCDKCRRIIPARPHPSYVILIIYIRLKVKRANRWAQLCRTTQQVFRSISPPYPLLLPHQARKLLVLPRKKDEDSTQNGKYKIHTSEKRDKLWFSHTSLMELLWKPDYASMEVCVLVCWRKFIHVLAANEARIHFHLPAGWLEVR